MKYDYNLYFKRYIRGLASYAAATDSFRTKRNKHKLNWIRLAEHGRIPTDCTYPNPRITYDGINWWITVGIECNVIIDIY